MKPAEILAEFDRFLAERRLTLSAIAIGGAALNLLGVISRPTKDCDILHPALPREIVDAARAFAEASRIRGEPLEDEWLNNGPSSLATHLPPGWQARVQPLFSGSALTLTALGRVDFLRAKLWALCDRGLDLPDCLALAPTAEELEIIRPWLEEQDANPDWPAHVRETLADVGRRLGHGV
jgi:hypothetical protein